MNAKMISAAVRSRRTPLWTGLIMIIALSWIQLARMNTGMPAMPDMMPMDGRHTMTAAGIGATLLPAFGMWSVMMAAMMLPTEMPAVSVYLALAARRHPARSATVPATWFVTGYLAVWLAYAAAAATAQSMLAPAVNASAALNAAILLTAGVFQFSRAKNACLTRCRSPLAFFLTEWRDGNAGALKLGLRRGSYCVGCCWALMALMFVVGTMNLLGMGVLVIFMLGEKLAPPGWRLGPIAGAVFVLCAAVAAATLVR
jgi:predicted metal-binding membrane protein